MEKEIVKGLFGNIALALVLVGAFLFIVGAGGGFSLISIEITELGWRFAIAILGIILIIAGFIIYNKEQKEKLFEFRAKSNTLDHELYFQRKKCSVDFF